SLPPDLQATPIVTAPPASPAPPTAMPALAGATPAAPPTREPGDVKRLADVHTFIPTRPRYEVKQYTVEANDTLFIIATKFNLRAETILWGNPTLADNPNLLSVGQQLNILPVDGALRIVQPGDTIEK